jgi:Predicted membrane protein (DUF2232)
LLLSRPDTARARIWLAAALLATATSLAVGPRTAAQDLVSAGALVFTGVMVGLAAFVRLSALPRAGLAAMITGLVLLIGAAAVGLEWSAVYLGLRTQFLDAVNVVHALAPLPATQLRDLQTGAEWMARIYPGIAILGALAAGVLATAVVTRVANHPAVPSPGRFVDFRFNDHLVWGAVATLAVALLPLPTQGDMAIANVLVVWAGLYIARGTAVFLTIAGRWPPLLRVALVLGAVVLLPYALGAALVMGLADTWFDFRRLLAPPSPGGPIP